jgi:hypothetical protein
MTNRVRGPTDKGESTNSGFRKFPAVGSPGEGSNESAAGRDVRGVPPSHSDRPIAARATAPSIPRPALRMIRLGLMLERSQADECASSQAVDARRVRRLEERPVWYLGAPFTPRRAAVGSAA